jgi:hypothetical protein
MDIPGRANLSGRTWFEGRAMNYLHHCIAAAFGALSVVTGSSVGAQIRCATPTVIDDSWSVKFSHLILRSSKFNYVIDNNHDCFELERQEFYGKLEFRIINRFPSRPTTTGYIFIKSVRTFSVSEQQEAKIKVSRGGGWYREDGSPGAESIDDRALRVPIQQWNIIHEKPGSPKDFNTQIGYSWHAFAEANKSLSSTEGDTFWKIPNRLEQTTGTITNYLLRFGVNPDEDKKSYVDFSVRSQPYVTRVELTMESNIGDLNNYYVFILK